METLYAILSGILSAIGVLALLLVISELHLRFRGRKFNVNGKHCYVTGGSSGLGKAVAMDLFKDGASVTIIARGLDNLKFAAEEIEKCRVNETQKIIYISSDTTDKQSSKAALEESVERQGKEIEYVFTCAGAAYPGYFIEQDVEVFEKSMQLNYFGALYTIHEATRRMVNANIKGHVVLVGSTLSMLGLVGYTQYSATKFAIRGLAEALRSELILHGINVSAYYPGTILSPGYEAENKLKPEISKKIEDAVDGLTPEQCSTALLKGLKRGEVAITSDFSTLLFRVASRGAMPMNNVAIDSVLAMIAWVALPIWRIFVDRTISTFQYGKPKAKPE
ncbi:3-ketodihydrosphingosine reductase TSC10 [Zancudomyces culisetae]|uniref:3-dehydrosphinganine reductase n=1 Tax=Zancudomyces culisetae TaxID=1213189 RepID=A0A1R1PRI2_ZANCU|nr:3-ketodihydrosphingosine reductase TSC10 [Zancudomyces culisetae]|eukprot:OMH83596.1 3-ketodihydrosphingosine reductase TSC10 [Zancudomyces culisetae]